MMPVRSGIAVCFLFGSIALNAPCSISDTNHTIGMTQLSNGNIDKGISRLKKAYQAHPSDIRIAFNYASVAPCSLSVAIYTRLSTDTKAPDSLRAAAYRQLGDYSFVHSAFKTAMEKYRLAASLHADPLYDHCRARAAAAIHDTATARPIWRKIAAGKEPDLAGQARYHLALLDMKDGAFDSAFNRLRMTDSIDGFRSWTVAAAAAKLECAIRLGKKDSVAVLEKKMQPFAGKLLEENLLNNVATVRRSVQKASPVVAPDAKSTTDSEYTLQVGAFSSLENATTLQKKLHITFNDVSILPVTIAENVFYRVRIGAFKSRSDAETFGGDTLLPSGIPYKVVMK